jgi:GNAT superfamily N-acetyltransferase
MSKYYIRTLEISELKEIYPRIIEDFAVNEYPPIDVLNNHLQQGRQEGYVLCDGTRDVAYSFCAASSANDYILITLLAIFKEYRGQGIGSVLLNELHKIYANKHAAIVEVEKSEEAQTAEERDKRLRRIAFYEKEGYCLLKGINYTIWDIPMHLMVCPLNNGNVMMNEEIEQIMHQIYFGLLGNRFINKMQFNNK